jgi:hypothetical protein
MSSRAAPVRLADFTFSRKFSRELNSGSHDVTVHHAG